MAGDEPAIAKYYETVTNSTGAYGSSPTTKAATKTKAAQNTRMLSGRDIPITRTSFSYFCRIYEFTALAQVNSMLHCDGKSPKLTMLIV